MEQKIINIYLESNPNPNSLKFVTEQELSPEPIDYASVHTASECPLAMDLFRFSFVKRVFITANFITITKSEDMDWTEISPMIKSLIKGYLEEGKPLFRVIPAVVARGLEAGEDNELVAKIKSILDEYIKPAVEQDGGAITFKSFDQGVVTVELQGSCSGCPSSTITLKSGIENLLKRMMPEVTEVVAESGIPA